MEERKYPSARIYKTTYNHLTGFVSNLYVSEVTPRFLKLLENYLSKNGVEVGSRGMTIYLSRIRAIYNMMMDEYEDLGYSFNYPFRKYKIPKCKEPKTIAVPKETIRLMMDAELTGKESFARDLFVISLLTCGTNTIDLFDPKEPADGRIEYNRSKTKGHRSDEAFISIKVEPELLPYVERYKGKDGFIFDFRDRYKNNKQLVKVIRQGLRSLKDTLKIDPVVYYDAR